LISEITRAARLNLRKSEVVNKEAQAPVSKRAFTFSGFRFSCHDLLFVLEESSNGTKMRRELQMSVLSIMFIRWEQGGTLFSTEAIVFGQNWTLGRRTFTNGLARFPEAKGMH
jgi:hypothetical protein